MDKLKPCPFCGEEEITHFTMPSLGLGHPGFISCNNDCSGVPVEAWNTRPIEDAQAATIAQQAETIKAQAAELATLRADAVTSRIAADIAANKISDQAAMIEQIEGLIRVVIPGEFIEFGGQLWIPTAKHEAALADKIQTIKDQAARIERQERIIKDQGEVLSAQAIRIEQMAEALEFYAFEFKGTPFEDKAREALVADNAA